MVHEASNLNKKYKNNKKINFFLCELKIYVSMIT